MKWILIVAIVMMVIMERIAKKAHAWADMIIDGVSFTDPTEGTFINSNMKPEYEGPGSHQWGAKFIGDIAWVYNNVCSRYWEKFSSSYVFYPDGDGLGRDSAYFDSERNYEGKTIFIYEQFVYENCAILTLTTSYRAILNNFEIRALVSGGFEIHSTLPFVESLNFFVDVHRSISANT